MEPLLKEAAGRPEFPCSLASSALRRKGLARLAAAGLPATCASEPLAARLCDCERSCCAAAGLPVVIPEKLARPEHSCAAAAAGMFETAALTGAALGALKGSRHLPGRLEAGRAAGSSATPANAWMLELTRLGSE